MKRYVSAVALVIILIIATVPTVLADPPAQGGGPVHYVQSGESLNAIAAQYGVSIEALMRQNGIVNPDMIYVGQALTIPGGNYTGPVVYQPQSSGCVTAYTVKPGDTLSSIAWNYGTTTEELLHLNGLFNADFVFAGQRLCVPNRAGYVSQPMSYASPQTTGAYYHTVTAGETISAICTRYKIDPWQVVQANNLENSSFIWAGQRLVIPGYQPTQSAPVTAPPPVVVSAPPLAAYSAPAPSYVKSTPVDNTLPAAPSYQKGSAKPLLPLAEHPIEVVVNGGETWADEVFSNPDPNGITTVVVQTGSEFGKTVHLRSGDYEVKGETQYLSGEFGPSSIAFRYLPDGSYDVWLDDAQVPSEKVQIDVDAGQRVNVAFDKQVRFQGQTYASPDGWVLSSWKNSSKPHQRIGGWSNILVKTPASNMRVIAESEGGGYKAACLTGSKGPNACDFAGLNAGLYFIHIDGTQLTLKTYMDGDAYAEFEFTRQPVSGEENKIGPVKYE